MLKSKVDVFLLLFSEQDQDRSNNRFRSVEDLAVGLREEQYKKLNLKLKKNNSKEKVGNKSYFFLPLDSALVPQAPEPASFSHPTGGEPSEEYLQLVHVLSQYKKKMSTDKTYTAGWGWVGEWKGVVRMKRADLDLLLTYT
jgi:hypothetical protein